jgi:hypothetical protein
MKVNVLFIEYIVIRLEIVLANAVQPMTIKPSADTNTKGTIFCPVLFQRGCPLSKVTSQMLFMVSRKTEKAPIAPPIEKPKTTIVVQTDEKGEIVLVISWLNNPATAGPATDEISWTSIWTAAVEPKKTENKLTAKSKSVGKGRIMKNVKAAARKTALSSKKSCKEILKML